MRRSIWTGLCGHLRHGDGCVLTRRSPVGTSVAGTWSRDLEEANDEVPESRVRVPLHRHRRRDRGDAACGAGGRRPVLQPEPHPLRPRHRGLGSAVRVSGDALHEQRLSQALDRRGGLQLVTRCRGQERGRSADRPVHRRAPEADGQVQVDVVAHSLGTSVMYDYLTNGPMAAQRRANVARYINVDGQAQNPGVPTLAVWAGRGTPGWHMDGARNVTIPNQTHVQTCTSAESFIAYYRFLTGSRPAHDIVRQNGAIQVAGRALNFPQNSGLQGATVQIWPLHADGTRTTAAPAHTIAITDGSTGGGDWGPVTVQSGKRYEFTVLRPGLPTLHIYYEPFVRSDYTLRLLASPAVETYAGFRPGSMSTVNIRYKEFWGDQGAQNDRLLVNGLNICNA